MSRAFHNLLCEARDLAIGRLERGHDLPLVLNVSASEIVAAIIQTSQSLDQSTEDASELIIHALADLWMEHVI